jgi:hypothetical protein
MKPNDLISLTYKSEEDRLRAVLLNIATLNAEGYANGIEIQWAESQLFRKIKQFAREALDTKYQIKGNYETI